jgi:hypothetical protein
MIDKNGELENVVEYFGIFLCIYTYSEKKK